jgi:2-hydroxymuconate-semialdehyde hydrolase
MTYEDRFIEVSGWRTHYLEAGEGPDVVLIHGGEFSASAELSWRHNIDAVAAAGFHVVAPDMLGYGQSAKIFDFENGQGFRMKHMARTLEALGVGSAHFAANSAGGHMLLKVMIGVIEADLDLASATLISPAPPALDGLEVLRSYDGSADHMRRILEVLFLDPKWATEELVSERQASALTPGAFECTQAAKLEPPEGKPALVRDEVDYAVISVPTLVVVGEQDKLLFEGLPEQVAQQAPLGRLEVIADAKHCAQIEQTARFNELFVDFLQAQSVGV